jgi:mannose-6-phosphate isomerase-like protein (cupin superfamily)
MRRTFVVAVLLPVVASVVLVAAQRRGAPAGGHVSFAVLVTDSTGAPLSDVEVTLTGPAERSGRTENGRIAFENLPAGAYRFRFDKDGFISLERELSARGSAPIQVKAALTAAPPPPPPPKPVEAPPPSRPVNAKPAVLDMPTFIEKNYVGRAAGKSTQLACSSGGAALLLQVNEPVAAHTHDEADEFVYVIAGQGTADIAGRQEPLSAGVFLLVPRGTKHAFTAGPKKPLVMLSTRAGERCGG